MESDGYGDRPGQGDIDHLLEDVRTLSAAGVERVAAGWEAHAGGDRHEEWHAAERAALHVLETTNRAWEWDQLRNRLMALTERGTPLVAWRSEHGDAGHHAEDALLGAALGLLARPELKRDDLLILLRPMAEALPWLTTR